MYKNMKKLKVLYANPIFFDYRLPFYQRLNELFDNQFYVMYSPFRYKGRFDAMLSRISEELGEHAIPFSGEKVFNTDEMAFRLSRKGKGLNFPCVRGLIRAVRRVKPDVLISEGFSLQLYKLWHLPYAFYAYFNFSKA